MPARVHAILVVRPEARATSASHLRATLAALAAQTRPVDALTIVLCGGDAEMREIVAGSGAEGVITAPHATGFAAATRLATPRLSGDAVWLLAQDTAPDPDALTRLAGALELAASVAFVAPKLVRWTDRSVIASQGVSMSPFGRTVELAADELDQGQHDADDDVLGSDVRGILVRREAWRVLDGLDPALAGADEGLDLGVRARLAGDRVSVVPAAVVRVAGDGVAGPSRRAGRRVFAERTAQLHRRLAYAPAVAVVAHWLSLLPLALWRTLTHFVGKQPGRVGPEWAASIVVLVRWGAVARARGRIRAARRAGWARLVPLRVSHAQLRRRLDGDGVDPRAPVRSDLRFFTGGGAWVVLGALAVSVAVFPALLAWPVLGGGALLPLRESVAQLWSDAAYGARAVGLAEIGPADPFAALVALVGSLWPGDPSRAMVVLWILALPLAVLGAWFAATRVSERSLLRIVGAIVWALSPTFLTALTEGRPSAVIVHLLLPWLFYTASVAHRSWAAAGAASLILVGVLAAAPSLAPAVVVLWLALLVATAAARRGRGTAHLIWLLIPAVVFFAPVVWRRVQTGTLAGLLADPGVLLGGGVAPDAAGRLLLVAGFPTADPGGWGAWTSGPTWWVPLLVAPLGLLALLSLITPRWVTGASLLVVAGVGLATAMAASGIAVAFSGTTAVALWPGAALSLAWLGALGAALVTLDAGIPDRLRAARPVAGLVCVAALAALSVPALLAPVRGASALTNGPVSTLPAFVAAEGRDDARLGTIVLDPRGDELAVRVVWGGSETLGGQNTLLSTRVEADRSDRDVAELAVALVSSPSSEAVDDLASAGIGFVLLTGAEPDTAGPLAISAATALDQRARLDPVGTTARGELWRVTGEVTPRAEPSRAVADTARGIALAQLAVVAIALLLAIPTATSRRQARRMPRIVGPDPGGRA